MADTSQRPLCRYFLHGTCRYKNGECLFSHDMNQAPSFTCKYFLQGCCVYGDACRYDHVRPAWAASRNTAHNGQNSSGQVTHSARNPVQGNSEPAATRTMPRDDLASAAFGDVALLPGGSTQTASHCNGRSWSAVLHATSGNDADSWEETAEKLDHTEFNLEYQQASQPTQSGTGAFQETQISSHLDTQPPQTASSSHQDIQQPQHDSSSRTSRMLCTSYAARGICPAGDRCTYVHGDECQVCHKHVLNPHDPEGCEEHIAQCTALHARLAARLRSAEVECGICLEKVMSAPKPSDRRFGLLSCDHAFCLKCIRAWRREGAADIETAIRACPVCRAPSYFITPSTVWPTSAEEKESIVSGYKAKLATIDCQHFKRGEGNCPFGTSCFYRHMYRDGTLQDRDACLRIARDQQGSTRVLGGVRLSDFFGNTRSSRRVDLRALMEVMEAAMMNDPELLAGFEDTLDSNSWEESEEMYEEESDDDWDFQALPRRRRHESNDNGSGHDGVSHHNPLE